MTFQHFGGYSTADHFLRAFSHLHMVGAGAIDMGIIGVLPTKGSVSKGSISKPSIPVNKTVALYKSSETTSPGYYKVDIESNITVELTTTQRTGAHRYQFRSGGVHNINLMAGYLLDKKGKRISTVRKCGDTCLEGSVTVLSGFGSRFGGYTIHFHAEWVSSSSSASSQEKVFLFNDTAIDESFPEVAGVWTGAIIQTTSPTFELFIGISYVSIINAKLNLEQEVPSLLWQAVLDGNQLIWQT